MAIIHLEQLLSPGGHVIHSRKITILNINLHELCALSSFFSSRFYLKMWFSPAKRAVGPLFNKLHFVVSGPDKLRSDKHETEFLINTVPSIKCPFLSSLQRLANMCACSPSDRTSIWYAQYLKTNRKAAQHILI